MSSMTYKQAKSLTQLCFDTIMSRMPSLVLLCPIYLNLYSVYSSLDGEPLYGFDSGIDPIVLENVNCSGTESDLSSCSRSFLGSIVNPVCRESNRAAGVRCKQRAGTCINDTVRLVDGPGFYEGRLEVCESHQWRTVCEEGFNAAAADSVCNHRLLLQGSMSIIIGSFNNT